MATAVGSDPVAPGFPALGDVYAAMAVGPRGRVVTSGRSRVRVYHCDGVAPDGTPGAWEAAGEIVTRGEIFTKRSRRRRMRKPSPLSRLAHGRRSAGKERT